MENRRRHYRHCFEPTGRPPVQLTLAGGLAVPGLLVDLSIGGMAVLTEKAVDQAPGGKGSENVTIGQVKNANNSTLLPPGFLQALGLDAGEVPPRQAVRLVDHKLQAYRYPNLRAGFGR